MPITAVIIVALFAVQRRGTAAVGRLFGPVMIVWFVAIGACGVDGIVDHPEILQGAVADLRASTFLAGHFGIAFFALAAVVLAVTGAEALYADMGHFGRRAITRGWLCLGAAGVHAELLRPGRADARRRADGERPVLPARARNGRGCRWCCWPPRRR